MLGTWSEARRIEHQSDADRRPRLTWRVNRESQIVNPLCGICAGGGGASVARPVGVEELAAGLVESLVGMGAEVVALGLEKVGRAPLRAIGDGEGQRGAEGRHRDALAG